MTTGTKPKRSLVGIELVRLLAYEGDRIFTTDRARDLTPRVGLKDSTQVPRAALDVGRYASYTHGVHLSSVLYTQRGECRCRWNSS